MQTHNHNLTSIIYDLISNLFFQVLLPPLNLLFTPTPELIALIEIALQRDYSSPHQQNVHYTTEHPKTLITPSQTPVNHETPKAVQQDYSSPHQQNFYYTTEHPRTLTPSKAPANHEKPKAVNSQIYKITIGRWTHVRVYPDDIKAKFYFAKKRIIWEFLDDVETGTQVERLKRKIEIQWSDVLSFRATYNSNDGTGKLEVEVLYNNSYIYIYHMLTHFIANIEPIY